MTVAELIAELNKFPPDVEVKCFDGCEDEWNRVPVGNVYLREDRDEYVMLEG